ncbi:MAG TPA: hypothetical protein PKD86_06175 [Gemmatales bacterium]|nr:hypothetical protein [Gemmatales bacterium]HMP58922.1 hypothetical protein [Gemmatales bacterium]
MISQALLDILVCPLGKSKLRLEDDSLICERCGPRFKIAREGYPNMLIEEADLPADCKRIDDLPCMREAANKAGSKPA